MARLKQIGIDVEVSAVIEKHRRTFSESENEILRRLLVDVREAVRPEASSREIDNHAIRGRGMWTVVRGKNREAAPNLKEAYRRTLLLLHEEFSDFLQRFSQEEARARRFVAKSPTDLYLKSPALARHHAKALADGWFFDTNLSTDQVARRVRIAAGICGLHYGTDLALLNNLQQI